MALPTKFTMGTAIEQLKGNMRRNYVVADWAFRPQAQTPSLQQHKVPYWVQSWADSLPIRLAYADERLKISDVQIRLQDELDVTYYWGADVWKPYHVSFVFHCPCGRDQKLVATLSLSTNPQYADRAWQQFIYTVIRDLRAHIVGEEA